MQAVSKGLEKVEQELTASENDGAISAGFRKVRKRKLLLLHSEMHCYLCDTDILSLLLDII